MKVFEASETYFRGRNRRMSSLVVFMAEQRLVKGYFVRRDIFGSRARANHNWTSSSFRNQFTSGYTSPPLVATFEFCVSRISIVPGVIFLLSEYALMSRDE